MEGSFSFTWYLGEWVTTQVANKWPPFIPRSIAAYVLFESSYLGRCGGDEVGHPFWDCVHHHGDYAPHL